MTDARRITATFKSGVTVEAVVTANEVAVHLGFVVFGPKAKGLPRGDGVGMWAEAKRPTAVALEWRMFTSRKDARLLPRLRLVLCESGGLFFDSPDWGKAKLVPADDAR